MIVAADGSVFLPFGTLVIGAMLAWGTSYFFKRRDERREVKGGVRLVESELRMAEGALCRIAPFAARLVEAETESEERRARHALRAIIADSYHQVADSAWRESRMLLGRHLERHEWDALRKAYASLTVQWPPEEVADDHPAIDSAMLSLKAITAGDILRSRVLHEARAVCQRHTDLPPVELPTPRSPEDAP